MSWLLSSRAFALAVLVSFVVSACAPALPAAVAIPGVQAPMSFDYLVADRAAGRVYLPVPGAGALEVLDVRTRSLRTVAGFKTGQGEWRGRKVVTGPSSVTLGKGVVYVGNHASSEVCVVDAASLVLGDCLHIGSPPDGLQYVAATAEVWITTPDAASLTILDASDPQHLRAATMVQPGGEPEGYAVDDGRGLFFTSLDKGTTLAIDVRTRQIRTIWHPGCNEDGPRGLALDSARQLLVVACTDHVQVLDISDGARGQPSRGRLDTGPGLDNLDYLPARHLLVAAAGRSATLTVAELADGGALTRRASIATVRGARNAVLDDAARAYFPDPAGAALRVVDVSAAPRDAR